jgi:hypothetical protein
MDIYKFVTVKRAEARKTTLLDRSRPTRSDDVLCADDTARDRVREYVRRFRARDPNVRKMLLIGGPSGVGKSLLATLVLEEAGYRVRVATSASTKKEIIDLLEQQTSAVLFDDLEAIMDAIPGVGNDLTTHANPLKGQRRATKKEKESCAAEHWPALVIATCKHPDYGKIVDVARRCEVVRMPRPPRSALIAYLKRIAPVGVDLGKIVDVSRRDVRQAIIALERGGAFSAKDEDVDAIGAVAAMMMMRGGKTPPSVSTTLRAAQMDAGVVPPMIFENYLDVAALRGPVEDVEAAAIAADSMSIADGVENAMYASGRFDLADVYLTHAAVAPAMAVRTASSGAVRFGNMWSKTSNMYVKRAVLRSIRDRTPGLWNVSSAIDAYAYASVLRAAYEKRLKGPIRDLAAVVDDPDVLVDVCRFGMRPGALSLVSLQTIRKRLVREKNMCAQST